MRSNDSCAARSALARKERLVQSRGCWRLARATGDDCRARIRVARGVSALRCCRPFLNNTASLLTCRFMAIWQLLQSTLDCSVAVVWLRGGNSGMLSQDFSNFEGGDLLVAFALSL